MDGIWSATVRRNSTLITELSTPHIIAALQQDTTQTVVQRQLQEGIAQLPEDVWDVSNLPVPDKRTRDTAKLETEEPAPQRRRQIDPIKELLRPSKWVVRLLTRSGDDGLGTRRNLLGVTIYEDL